MSKKARKRSTPLRLSADKQAREEQEQIADTVRARGVEFVTRLVTELEARGHKVERPGYVKDDTGLFYPHGEPGLSIYLVDGERVRFHLEIQRNYRRCTYTYTGRLRCVIGDYPRKNYSEPMKGFDLETTITRVLNVAQDVREGRQTYKRKVPSAQAATLQRACELLGVDDDCRTIGDGVKFREGDAERVKVTLMVTPEDLVWLVKATRDESKE